MKKVFSIEVFKKHSELTNYNPKMVRIACNGWAKECEGLTKEEMKALGYVTKEEWMVEVEECQNQ